MWRAGGNGVVPAHCGGGLMWWWCGGGVAVFLTHEINTLGCSDLDCGNNFMGVTPVLC